MEPYHMNYGLEDSQASQKPRARATSREPSSSESQFRDLGLGNSNSQKLGPSSNISHLRHLYSANGALPSESVTTTSQSLKADACPPLTSSSISFDSIIPPASVPNSLLQPWLYTPSPSALTSHTRTEHPLPQQADILRSSSFPETDTRQAFFRHCPNTVTSAPGSEAMQFSFDPNYGAGYPHPTTWSVANMNGHFINQLSQHVDPFHTASGTMDAMVLPSSQTNQMYHVEQRGQGRSRDTARRENKCRVRKERSLSSSYGSTSLTSSPNMLHSTAPGFSESLNALSIPAEGLGSSFPTAPYLPSSSSAISSSVSPELYGMRQFPLTENDINSVNHYLMPYSTPYLESPPITTYEPRQHSQSVSSSDSSYFYRQPAIANQEANEGVRLVNSRPKPRCWDHGCNGRPFSTFSNLLRHQREKSGMSTKPSCPRCGAEFTRSTARNGHLAHEKCKMGRD